MLRYQERIHVFSGSVLLPIFTTYSATSVSNGIIKVFPNQSLNKIPFPPNTNHLALKSITEQNPFPTKSNRIFFSLLVQLSSQN